MEVKEIIKEDRNEIIPSYEYRDYFRKDGSRRYNSHREANWYKIGVLDCFDYFEQNRLKACDNQTPDEAVSEYMLDMFPELKESDDEGIRKELINYCYERLNTTYGALPNIEAVKRWLAWLEKQDETFTKRDVDDAYLKGISDCKGEMDKQKTTWKPTEEQIEALEHLLETIRRHEYSYFHEEKFFLLHSLLEQLKKLTFCSPKIFR